MSQTRPFVAGCIALYIVVVVPEISAELDDTRFRRVRGYETTMLLEIHTRQGYIIDKQP